MLHCALFILNINHLEPITFFLFCSTHLYFYFILWEIQIIMKKQNNNHPFLIRFEKNKIISLKNINKLTFSFQLYKFFYKVRIYHVTRTCRTKRVCHSQYIQRHIFVETAYAFAYE